MKHLKTEKDMKNKIILIHKSSLKRSPLAIHFTRTNNASAFTPLNYMYPSLHSNNEHVLAHAIFKDFILIAAKYFIIYKYHILLTACLFVGHVGSFYFLIFS